MNVKTNLSRLFLFFSCCSIFFCLYKIFRGDGHYNLLEESIPTTIQNNVLYVDSKINFTTSKRPKMLNPFNGKETHHVCLGGEDELREFGPLTRHCVFKNMCLKLSTHQWLYYTGNQHTPRAVGVHKGNRFCKENCDVEDPFIYTDFASAKQPFVNVKFETSIDSDHVTPVVVNDRIPNNAFFDLGETKFTIHVFSKFPDSSINAIGHLLAEYIYPVFHGLDLVGVIDRDVKLLFNDSPCPNGMKCPIFFEAIKSISKYYPLVSNIIRNYPPSEPPNTYHPDLVCYKLLYIGSGDLHASSRVHHPDSWGRFVERIVYGMGLDPFRKPDKQRILMINKGGSGLVNRIAFNGKDVAEKIRQQFQVDVDYFVYNGETFRQEVEMVQKYTVCITVCGGTAFGCTFLPDGAANIYIATWYSEGENGRPGANNNMEHVTWTYDRRHKYYAYPVWINETAPDTSPAGYSENYKYLKRWKHNKGFVIDFPRMAVLVNDALSYAEASFEYENSFKRLQKVTRNINYFTIIA